ncbi:MAG: insulinase family protein [Rhodobacteraceae bacterium]|nr:insulinase family protein [Paracoccaceae bacterium]
MIRALALVAAALLAGGAGAEPVTTFRLDNGLEGVVIEDHRAPVVVHMVWYRVGSADETAGRSGLAHFLEHLMFKGTATRAPGEFSALVDANGGSDNAFTSWDYTGYIQRIAADRLELMMTLEADRMTNLRLPEAEVLTERDVVLEERAQNTESRPGALMAEQMRAAMFLNHRYGVPNIGWRHEIAALTAADAEAFYRAHYAPDNAILIVAGDVTAAAVEALARRHYGGIAARDLPPRERAQDPPPIAERRVILRDPRVAQPYLSRWYLAPVRRPGEQAEAAALVVLAEILGGTGATSVLGRALEFDGKVAIGTSASYDATGVDSGLFAIGVIPAAGVEVAAAEAALDAALDRFLTGGIDPEHFARIRMQVRAAEVFARDNVQGRARRWGEALTAGLSVADVEGWPAALQAVTPEAVMAAARTVLDRRRSVTGWLLAPAAGQAGEAGK